MTEVDADATATPAVEADKTHVFAAEATSGAGGGKIGIAGSFALNIANVRTLATIAPHATVTAGGDVALTAASEATSTAKALPGEDGASGSAFGLGASVALNLVSDRAWAIVSGGAHLTGAAKLTPRPAPSHEHGDGGQERRQERQGRRHADDRDLDLHAEHARRDRRRRRR